MSKKKRLRTAAKKAISLLDLTNLNNVCTRKDIKQLCANAQTPFGNTAAICIWKERIPQARKLLKGTGIKIATVVNFPKGGTNIEVVKKEIRQALKDGADEIDLVLPYKAYLKGNKKIARQMVRMAAKTCKGKALLKVIVETGELKQKKHIKGASMLAISSGADFIKTSTGKVEVNATLESAEIMLKAIRKSGKKVGFKPAGGIKTTADAASYLKLASDIMGKKWAKPATLRFGASSVLADLVATLEGKKNKTTAEGY